MKAICVKSWYCNFTRIEGLSFLFLKEQGTYEGRLRVNRGQKMKDSVGLIQELNFIVCSHGQRESIKFQAAELCGQICIFPENSHTNNLQQCKLNWEAVKSSRVGHEKVLNFSVKWDSRGRMSMEREGDRINWIKGGRQLHFSSRASFPYLPAPISLGRLFAG